MNNCPLKYLPISHTLRQPNDCWKAAESSYLSKDSKTRKLRKHRVRSAPYMHALPILEKQAKLRYVCCTSVTTTCTHVSYRYRHIFSGACIEYRTVQVAHIECTVSNARLFPLFTGSTAVACTTSYSGVLRVGCTRFFWVACRHFCAARIPNPV
jgi:hypothetical protein